MPRVEIDLAAQAVDPITSAVFAAIGASALVYKRNSDGTNGAVAVVYSDPTSGTTVANPITVDSAGRIQGWVNPGRYNLVISGAGLDSFTQPWDAADVNTSSTATQPGTKTTVGTSAVTLVSANPTRIELGISNDHATAILYLSLGGTAVSTQGIRINPGGFYSTTTYQGAVSIISDTASTNVAWYEI